MNTPSPQFDHKVFPGAVPRSFLGSIILAWLSNHVARLANDLSLITTKFDLQIVSSYSPSLSTVPRLTRTSPPRPRKYKCTRALLPSTRGRSSVWALDVRLVCPHYREPVPPAILDGTDVAQHVCAAIRLVMRLNQFNHSFTPPVHSEPRAISTVRKRNQASDSGGSATDIRCGGDPRRTCCSSRFLRYPTLVRWQDLSHPSDQSRPHLQSSICWCVTFLSARICTRSHTAALTVLIDSYFWDHWPLWPELFSIYFNVYKGKSVEWGVGIFFIQLLRHLILLRYLHSGLTSQPSSRAFL